jgi:hypothetical protein
MGCCPFGALIEASLMRRYHNKEISDFRGAGLFYRNKKYRGIVLRTQENIYCQSDAGVAMT